MSSAAGDDIRGAPTATLSSPHLASPFGRGIGPGLRSTPPPIRRDFDGRRRRLHCWNTVNLAVCIYNDKSYFDFGACKRTHRVPLPPGEVR